MGRTRWQTLVVVFAGCLAVTWLVLHWWESGTRLAPSIPWPVIPVLLVVAAVLFTYGWTVRQYLRGTRPNLDPIRAVRTAMFAKAASISGALLAGWYGAQLLLVMEALVSDTRRERALIAGLAVIASLAVMVVGLIVEWFCQIPPDNNEKDRVTRAPDSGSA